MGRRTQLASGDNDYTNRMSEIATWRSKGGLRPLRSGFGAGSASGQQRRFRVRLSAM